MSNLLETAKSYLRFLFPQEPVATSVTPASVTNVAPKPDSLNFVLNSELVQNLSKHKNEPFVWKDATFGKSTTHLEVSPLIPSENHLINAFVNAYNTHSPLKLSPDHILLAIGHNVSTYINKNSEVLKSRFVDFGEKKTLCVRQDTENWDTFVGSMAELIKDNVKNELTVLLIPDFSTTDQVNRTVGGMTVMSAFKSYFSYEFMMMCGIPSVTLEGTNEDWNKLNEIYNKIKVLLPELAPWYKHFDKIMLLFLNMKKTGIVTDDMKILWERCVTYVRMGSGGQTYLGGWIHLFYPFTKGGELLKIPDAYAPLDSSIPDPDPAEHGHYDFQDVQREFYLARGWQSISPSVFSCEAKYFKFDVEYNVELKSGFVGSVYDGTHFTPVVGWGICDKQRDEDKHEDTMMHFRY